jgi:hypothetical protein
LRRLGKLHVATRYHGQYLVASLAVALIRTAGRADPPRLLVYD